MTHFSVVPLCQQFLAHIQNVCLPFSELWRWERRWLCLRWYCHQSQQLCLSAATLLPAKRHKNWPVQDNHLKPVQVIMTCHYSTAKCLLHIFFIAAPSTNSSYLTVTDKISVSLRLHFDERILTQSQVPSCYWHCAMTLSAG